MAGAIDVGIMPVIGLIFDMGGGNGNTTLALLGSFINGAIVEEAGETLLGLSFRNRSGQCGLLRSIVRLVICWDDRVACTLP